MKPLIALLPLYKIANDSIWMNRNYASGIEAAGGIPVILPLSGSERVWEELLNRFDGFVFTGGQDVAPSLYGQETLPQCGPLAPERDAMEMWLLKKLMAQDRPVLGICRGVQMLNIAAGGQLYQDLPSQLGTGVTHFQSDRSTYTSPVHGVSIAEGSMLFDLVGSSRLQVNSIHHQGISVAGSGLTPTAFSDDGLTEAVEMPGKRFVLGIQWHPEYLWKNHEHALNIFKGLINAAKI